MNPTNNQEIDSYNDNLHGNSNSDRDSLIASQNMSNQGEFPEYPSDEYSRGDDKTLSYSHLEARFEKLYHQVQELISTQSELFKAELGEKSDKAKSGVIQITSGTSILIFAGGALVASAILGLSLYFQPWLAALIVGAVLSAVGAMFLASGKKNLSAKELKLKRSMRSWKKNVQTLQKGFQS